jgi:hypothetical protein
MAHRVSASGGLTSRREALLAALEGVGKGEEFARLRSLLVVAVGLAGAGETVVVELKGLLQQPSTSGALRELMLGAVKGVCAPDDVGYLVRLLRDEHRFLPMEPKPGEREVYWEYPVRMSAAARLAELGVSCPMKVEGDARSPSLSVPSLIDGLGKWLRSSDDVVRRQAIATVQVLVKDSSVEGLNGNVTNWQKDARIPEETRKALSEIGAAEVSK